MRLRKCERGLVHALRATQYVRPSMSVWYYPHGPMCEDLLLPIEKPEFPTCLWCAAAVYQPW